MHTMVKQSPQAPAHLQPDPNRSVDLPLDEIHRHLEEAVEKLKPPKVKHACRSAWNHLKKAWVLHPIDAEMSLFRAITAEEEAATALIRALQFQCYPNADRLKDRQHSHKASIWPLIVAINDMRQEKNIPLPKVGLRAEGKPRIEVSIDIAGQAGLPEPLWGTPDEPFNWSMWSDKTGSFKPHDFSDELAALAARKGANSIATYVAAEANRRNQLLYASDRGVPAVFFSDSVLIDRRKRVTVLLTLTVAVLQTSKHQTFFVQCLDALLRTIQKFDGEPVWIPPMDRTVTRLELAEQEDGTMRAAIVRPIIGYSFKFSFHPRNRTVI